MILKAMTWIAKGRFRPRVNPRYDAEGLEVNHGFRAETDKLVT